MFTIKHADRRDKVRGGGKKNGLEKTPHLGTSPNIFYGTGPTRVSVTPKSQLHLKKEKKENFRVS